MTIKKLQNQNLPKFILFKNLKFKEGAFEFNTCCIESAEVIAITDTPSEAMQNIPDSIYPTDVEKLKLFEDKYGDRDDVDFGYNVSPYAIIDFDSNDLENTPDFDIFGESYSLLWVCPIDDKKIIKTLIDHTINYAKEKKCRVGDVIGNIWDEYIDSISIATEDEMFDTPEFVFNIKQEYEAQLSKLPDGPTQKDWDYLDEMLLK